MVRPLDPPTRPLTGGTKPWTWTWRAPTATRPWQYCRIYHKGPHSPHGTAHRPYGPLYRFDPHTPDPANPELCPDGRTVLYVGADLATSASEVFGEAREAALCPRYRVALLRPTRRIRLQDLISEGAAMSIGALPALSDGHLPRPHTQKWARAICEDQPSGAVRGIVYRSAYNAARALALWNCEDSVETVVVRGRAQDYALSSPQMYGTMLTAMAERRIGVTLISSAQCRACPDS